MLVSGLGDGPSSSSPDATRDAAEALHRQFLAEMLKQARIGEALGGSGSRGSGDLAGSLMSMALEQVAKDVASTQPDFTEALYRSLQRTDDGSA